MAVGNASTASVASATAPGHGATATGANSVALGASKSTNDGRLAFKAGATVTARGQAGGSAGFGFSF